MKITEHYDQSSPSWTLQYLELLPMTRMKTEKVIEFSPRAEESHKAQIKDFVD